MRPSTIYCFQILAATISAQIVALPYDIRLTSHNQQPLMPSPDQATLTQNSVLISDVMGRDRSMNIFASFTRDVASVSDRLNSASQNSTVLAPLNSAVDKLPRKPWEDAKEYEAFGANAYEGDDGQSRAQKNLRKFVEAHVVATSPWPEKERARTLLDGDREIWWEMKDGARILQPDGVEIQNIASRVGNGEVWILKAVRNYA